MTTLKQPAQQFFSAPVLSLLQPPGAAFGVTAAGRVVRCQSPVPAPLARPCESRVRVLTWSSAVSSCCGPRAAGELVSGRTPGAPHVLAAEGFGVAAEMPNGAGGGAFWGFLGGRLPPVTGVSPGPESRTTTLHTPSCLVAQPQSHNFGEVVKSV